MSNTKRQSPECSIAQLQRTLINVTNIQTIPDNTLVVDSNLAVANCIEMNQNVCIGIIGITGSVQPQPLLARGASDFAESWRSRSIDNQSLTRLRTIAGPTGSFAPQNINNVLIGNEVGVLGQDASNIAIGDQAVGGGETGGQLAYNTAIGYNAAFNGQGYSNIALGDLTAAEGGQGEDNIAIGTESAIGGQQFANIAIGNPATVFQTQYNVAIGHYTAFQQDEGNVAIGAYAANVGQDSNAIAIGAYAAAGNFESSDFQSSNSIAIGAYAGAASLPVPEYSVQLGYQSNVISNYEPEGIVNAGVAIGPNSSSVSGALVLNTDLSGLTGTAPGTFIKPVRQLAPVSSHYMLDYDSSTNEICYKTQLISGVSGGGGNGTVNFGITFASPPSVTATVINPGDTDGVFSVTLYNITTTSFSFRTRYISNTSGGVQVGGEAFNWNAIGYYLD